MGRSVYTERPEEESALLRVVTPTARRPCHTSQVRSQSRRMGGFSRERTYDTTSFHFMLGPFFAMLSVRASLHNGRRMSVYLERGSHG